MKAKDHPAFKPELTTAHKLAQDVARLAAKVNAKKG